MVLSDFNDCSYEGVNDALFNQRRHRGSAAGPRLHATLFSDSREDRESDELEIIVLNLTGYGLGLELAREVLVGETYSLGLDIGGQSLRTQIKITSCAPIADGLYRAAAEPC
jgi:hypothetical protein